MKTLLFGLFTLGTISAFADNKCDLYVANNDFSEKYLDLIQERISEKGYNVTSEEVANLRLSVLGFSAKFSSGDPTYSHFILDKAQVFLTDNKLRNISYFENGGLTTRRDYNLLFEKRLYNRTKDSELTMDHTAMVREVLDTLPECSIKF